jgi:DNA-binding transcriptional LysR family regulator
MRAELRTYATGLKGRIRLMANSAALATFLPGRLCRFLTDHPDLSVDLEERPSSAIAVAVAAARVDLGIAASIADLAALQTRLIAHDQLVVVAPAAHRLGARQSVAFSDIVDEAFVGMADAALEIHLGERAARLGRQIHYRVQLRGAADVATLVAAGVGIAVLPEACAAALRRPELALLPLAEPWAARQLYLCARDFCALTPHAGLLAQQLMQAQVALA